MLFLHWENARGWKRKQRKRVRLLCHRFVARRHSQNAPVWRVEKELHNERKKAFNYNLLGENKARHARQRRNVCVFCKHGDNSAWAKSDLVSHIQTHTISSKRMHSQRNGTESFFSRFVWISIRFRCRFENFVVVRFLWVRFCLLRRIHVKYTKRFKKSTHSYSPPYVIRFLFPLTPSVPLLLTRSPAVCTNTKLKWFDSNIYVLQTNGLNSLFLNEPKWMKWIWNSHMNNHHDVCAGRVDFKCRPRINQKEM